MAKGSCFERDFCRMLSRWYTNGDRDDIFWRSHASGARATSRNKLGKSTHGQHGDICASDPIGDPLIQKITIELKRGYSKHTFFDMIDRSVKSKPSVFEGFLEQAISSSKAAGTPYWMLVHRRDRRDSMVFIPRKLHTKLLHDREYVVPLIKFCSPYGKGKSKVVHGVVYEQVNFFQWFTPKDLLNA